MLSTPFAALAFAAAALIVPSALSTPLDADEIASSKLAAVLESRSYTPSGGVGVSPNDPPPVYHVSSDFDFQSFNLALNQEYIELDLFHNGLARFSTAEFDEAGINAEQRALIEFMADQEVSHAELISNILGSRAAKQCTYEYPFHTVRQFVDFCQKLTRFGESGVYGFLSHLDSRPSATLLTQSITTEARQQQIFRQLAGATPMAVHFEAGLPQAWAWTMLSPYIKSCPSSNPYIEWQIFPSLNITNNPSIIDTTADGSISTYESGTTVYYPTVYNGTGTSSGNGTGISSGNSTGSGSSSIYLSSVATNRTSLSYPGRRVNLVWEAPGKTTGYNNKYKTATTAPGPAKYALWVSQLNATYTPLQGIKGRSAYTLQPNGTVFPIAPSRYASASNVPGAATDRNYIVNDTMFIALTDRIVPITSYNLSLINQYIVAGPALYQAD